MESTKFFTKGYGKVKNPLDNQESISNSTRKTTHRRRLIISASITFVSAIVVAVMVLVLVHKSPKNSPEEEKRPSSSSISSNSVESLKTVCAVTRYPDSCFSSISSLNNPPKPDPVHFFNLSLQFSLQEVKNLSSLPKELISKSNDKRVESALLDCSNLFDNSLSQLNDSAQLMIVNPGEKVFTEMKISDLQTWISAAMTDEDTCLNGLEEMGGSTAVDEIKTRVQKSQEYMSNSLAILNNLQSLLGKFGLTMP
ncbi:hypothetical protein M9H77_04898 [Catharanthus roseus]|uniref:Uncharacterized protein n=1 Tax=Catharanthus roseus TaxID=4058 RepID=A0ACC0CFJ9_CATRO|nr:hypothetical protein M9H77_04898 [Catharanthus roseus]